jgi:acyl-CoA thioesterase-1
MELMTRRLLLKLSACIFAAFAATAAQAAQTILVWGDSLSAGYGLDAGTGWVWLLEQRVQTQAPNWQVVNASVSGETTAGGLSRLPAALDRYKPAIVLIELGGNDGLHGGSLELMRDNLIKMVDLTKRAGAKPVIFEMRIPENYGPVYTKDFTDSFTTVTKAEKVPMVPFFLAAIATDFKRWFQEDAIHPNASAQPQMLDAVWPTLAPLIGVKAASPAPKSP